MRGPRRRRSLRIEPLESRRLLAAEGASADLTVSFETMGLHGALATQVDWADGSQSAAEVTSGRVYATIDYRYDSRGFFTTPRTCGRG